MYFTITTLICIFFICPHTHAFQVKLSHKLSGTAPIALPKPKLTKIKLPVWPVWSGVIAQILEWIGQNELASKLISLAGGRVVPMELANSDVSPFLLLVHHSHSFMPLDPFRFVTNLILPEGFPAHPHSGFDTVTMTLQGGLRHRDSEGIQQQYKDGDTQWMRAGRGVIHEEMWDTGEDTWGFKRIEIFQLWVNLDKESKNNMPLCEVIRANTVPEYHSKENGVHMKVICGDLRCKEEQKEEKEPNKEAISLLGPGSAIADSPIFIAHLSMRPKSTLSLVVPAISTSTIYIRQGSLRNNKVANDEIVDFQMNDLIQYHSGGITTETEKQICIESGENGVEALLLFGRPIKQPVLWQGPIVASDEESFRLSAGAFNAVEEANGYWPHTFTDDQWREHINKLNLQGVISAANRRGVGSTMSRDNSAE